MTLQRSVILVCLAAPAVFAAGQVAQARPSSAGQVSQEQTANPPIEKHISPSVAEIDASPRVVLRGNVRPEATPANDLGPVDDALPMEHVLLELKRSPGRQAALDAFSQELTEKGSANYHRWLTPEEFGARFGVDESDIGNITAWLGIYGIQVNAVYTNRMMIDFSCTAGQIRAAFRTEIHWYSVDGVRHIANASDPAIPSALAPVIEGIVSLHDFHARPMLRRQAGFTAGSGQFATYPVTPQDLATIYNLTPVFHAGYAGKGQLIAVIEGSDVHSAADWTVFRAAFGLSGYTSGSFRQIHPAAGPGGSGCKDPGVVNGWDEESILDAEYASAVAPDAEVEVASCANTATTSGNLIALENVVDGPGGLPSVISISYGSCEAANGSTANSAINAAYEQAAAEGIAVFAAAGDGGAAFCDVGASVASHGIGVNAYASTEWNVAVGGTDFADTYEGKNSTYWNRTNTSSGESARSYIPEIPWDDSCANPLIADWYGFSLTYSSAGFCRYDFNFLDEYQTTVAGGGGPSGCAWGAPTTAFEVGGTCRGWGKPGWQAIAGNPKDGVRDLPDVAMFAADGIWGHFFLYCDSNPGDYDGAPCNTGKIGSWSEAGGTSFAAPIMAGIQALVVEKWGRQGNPDPVYYRIAAGQFAASATADACKAENGASSGATCVFHDLTQGATTVNCEGTVRCYNNVLSTSSSGYAQAYPAQTGWDFASGLGSVNAYNLVMSSAW
jgi:subtilase family serine protease